MNSKPSQSLLAEGDPPPVRIINPAGSSAFLLLGDHAGNIVPAALGSLGLSDSDLARHIGWDIGVADLGVMLAEKLDAVFVRQSYSRLVIDCNRDPDAPTAIPEVSDGTTIPGNIALSAERRSARLSAIHQPYQNAIADELATRNAAGRGTILVSLHSFTPSMDGVDRPWHIGILHGGGDTAFALTMLEGLHERGDLIVGDNQPYAMDGIDYTVPRHAFGDRLRYVEIEIRQDLLSDRDQCARWSDILATELTKAAKL